MNTPSYIAARCLLAAVCVAPIACDDPPDPIVASWRSQDRINGELNEMEIDADLEGEATIYFVLDGSMYYADFDVTAERDGHGYALEFDCQGPCADLDFKADCDLDDDELECDADGLWSDYEFAWELD